MRRALPALLAATLLVACAVPASANTTRSSAAALVSAGVQTGTATQEATLAKATKHSSSGDGLCGTFDVIVTAGISCGAKALVGAVGSALGSAAASVGSSILDGIAGWVIGAATTITAFIASLMAQTTTPQLTSGWYTAQFAPMAALGGGLALLVAIVALGSAALRRNGGELGQILAAILRAGFGTGVVIALTVMGLQLADAISSAFLSGAHVTFWETLNRAWGNGTYGGFGSTMLAALMALIEVVGAIAVWLELIVRNAVIYIAVLFFPLALAAGIWRPLAAWPGRLGRLLLLFIILKPIVLIVLSLGASAATAGLSGASGFSQSVGTILAGTVIFLLAAACPWALMFLLAVDAEHGYAGAGMYGNMRTGAAGSAGGAAGRVGGRIAGVGAGGIARLGGNGAGGAGGGSGGNGRGGGSTPQGGPGGGPRTGSGGGGAPHGGRGHGAPGRSGPSTSGGSAGPAVTASGIGSGAVGAAAGFTQASRPAAGTSTGGVRTSPSGSRAPRRTPAAGDDQARSGARHASRATPPGGKASGRAGAAPGATRGARPPSSVPPTQPAPARPRPRPITPPAPRSAQ